LDKIDGVILDPKNQLNMTMMPMTKISKNGAKNIACLEALWDDNLEQRIGATALLDLVCKISDVNFTLMTCNTRAEFEFCLYKLCISRIKKHYGVLYLVFHGDPGQIFLSDEVPLSLEELADIMGDRFKGWVVHFSSCSTLAIKEPRLKNFIQNTKVSLVIGYTKDMYWSECMAMDLLLLENIADYKRLWNMKKRVESRYGELAKMTGLRFYPGR
jgi:hypothetical protein